MIYYQLGLYKGFYKKIEKMFISAKNGRHCYAISVAIHTGLTVAIVCRRSQKPREELAANLFHND